MMTPEQEKEAGEVIMFLLKRAKQFGDRPEDYFSFLITVCCSVIATLAKDAPPSARCLMYDSLNSAMAHSSQIKPDNIKRMHFEKS